MYWQFKVLLTVIQDTYEQLLAIFPSKEREKLADKFSLLTDPDLNRHLRTNGCTWVEDHYAWWGVYQQMGHVYAWLLGTKADPC